MKGRWFVVDSYVVWLSGVVCEFDALFRYSSIAPKSSKGVVVLSAPPDLSAQDEERREANPENVARVTKGVGLALNFGATLFLNGETEQLPWMKKIARDLGFSANKTIPVNCGERGVANTKTQFEVMGQEKTLMGIQGLIIVTSLYHVPRVKRTAQKYLPESSSWQICGLTQKEFPFDASTMIGGEMKRIIDYTRKGDICW